MTPEELKALVESDNPIALQEHVDAELKAAYLKFRQAEQDRIDNLILNGTGVPNDERILGIFK